MPIFAKFGIREVLILHDAVHVFPHVAHFRVLRCLHTQERRVGQFSQPSCQLSFAAPGWPLDQQIFGDDLLLVVLAEVSAPPSVPKSTRYCFLGFALTDHKPVEILN